MAGAVAQHEPAGVGVLLQREPEGGEPDDLPAVVDGEREGERGTGDGEGAVPALLQLEAGGRARVGGIAARDHAEHVAAGAVEPRATVGSGDAFLAGYVAARYSGKSTEECLAFGVACGARKIIYLVGAPGVTARPSRT